MHQSLCLHNSTESLDDEMPSDILEAIERVWNNVNNEMVKTLLNFGGPIFILSSCESEFTTV